jgi:hypothetical protein
MAKPVKKRSEAAAASAAPKEPTAPKEPAGNRITLSRKTIQVTIPLDVREKLLSALQIKEEEIAKIKEYRSFAQWDDNLKAVVITFAKP